MDSVTQSAQISSSDGQNSAAKESKQPGKKSNRIYFMLFYFIFILLERSFI